MTTGAPKNVLIITSSGGGGLLQAAKAKEQEIRKKYPDVNIVRKDLLIDWIGKFIGNFGEKRWNTAQRKGDIRIQEQLINQQKYAEYLFWAQIFYWTLKTIFNEDIDHVIDTQAIGTSPILKAIRIYNRKRNKKVMLEKVVVDLPTRKATHFFRTVKKLSENDRKFFKLVTIDPLCEENETPEQFWKEQCNLTSKEIQYEYYYIRDCFRDYQDKPRTTEPFTISINVKGATGARLIEKTFQKGRIKGGTRKGGFDFKIMSQDKLFTILLGSQPSTNGTLNYVKQIVKGVQNHGDSQRNYHLFVYCAEYIPGEKSLFRQVYEALSRVKNYPKNLSVIPMSFQDESVIAPLFYRSDMTITRSGGQTAMELMSVMHGQIFVHSEAKTLDREGLLRGIPGWESGNAVYLEEKNGAKIITPDTLPQYLDSCLT